MNVLESILLTVFCILVVIVVIMSFNIANTYKNCNIILDAVHEYNMDCLDKDDIANIIPYSHIKEFDKALHNIFDWGYENILPQDDYERVKPFIKEGKRK